MGGCVVNSRKKIQISLSSSTTLSVYKQSILLIKKTKQLLQSNPIKLIPYNHFKENILGSISTSLKKSEQIKQIIWYLNLGVLNTHLYRTILEISIDKFNGLFPDSFIVENCASMLYYLLCKEADKKELKNFLYFIIKICQTKTETNDDVILTGKLSYIVIHIIILLTYIVLYMFIGVAYVDVYENKFNIGHELDSMLLNEQTDVKLLSNKIINKIKDINPFFSREEICVVALRYIFLPLSTCM